MQVILAEQVREVPGTVQGELRLRLVEIADGLQTIPKGSPLWKSMTMSGFLLDVGPWRFEYRIEQDGRYLLVASAAFRGT